MSKLSEAGAVAGVPGSRDDRREGAVIKSALWAAAGDALGWITELSYGAKGVVRRTGTDKVTSPVEWRRVIGGRGGPTVDLPAGTYSDDTQMRLAVSRAIRGDGTFDVEAFAKIEVTVWPVYALGAGLSTKAAAASLARRKVNWFSNFFERGRQQYVLGGGNGAAMRVQPHVWAMRQDREALIQEVLRDALVTHGHPHGFCGAVFHALCLAETLDRGEPPTLRACHSFIEALFEIVRLVDRDSQLSMFWKGHWEQSAGMSLDHAMKETCMEIWRDIEVLDKEFHSRPATPEKAYHRILSHLGCLEPRYRGSGLKTALAAVALSQLFSPEKIERCLTTAANELDSDTDTIATMAGAILGSASDHEPNWPIQDRGYIVDEARRLSLIARGEMQESFAYPDLNGWTPPTKQNAGVGRIDGKLAVAGLGRATPASKEYSTRLGSWQWLRLSFGQTVLAKKRKGEEPAMPETQLPIERKNGLSRTAGRRERTRIASHQTSLPFAGRTEKAVLPTLPDDIPAPVLSEKQRENDEPSETNTVDAWTNEVIHSGFDEIVLGRTFNRCIDQSQSVEAAVGFAAIVAKAKLARQRRKK